MSTEYKWRTVLAITGVVLLGLAWWGWSQSALALLQLGLGVC